MSKGTAVLLSQHSEDSWSEEEGEVSEDDGHRTRCRISYSGMSSEGIFSEEENTSDISHSTPDGLLSTGSAENLQMELAKCSCVSDGLSDKEATVRKLRNQMTSSPDRIFEVGLHCLCFTNSSSLQLGVPSSLCTVWMHCLAGVA